MQFKEFYFDTNQVKGTISTMDQWIVLAKKFRQIYEGSDIYACRQGCGGGNDYGLCLEHNGDKTLGDFFDENGMEKI